MQIQEGEIVKGRVTGINDYGAFVELEGGKTGMIHISEVSSGYVKDINEHLKVNQEVTAKVISINEKGKISLSIRKLDGAQPKEAPAKKTDSPRGASGEKSRSQRPPVWQGVKQTAPSGEKQSFEEMMASFKKASDEKMSALKRTDSKRGSVGYSRRNKNS